MGTLRFFEEVVSFKIRRTFGFADYRCRLIGPWYLSGYVQGRQIQDLGPGELFCVPTAEFSLRDTSKSWKHNNRLFWAFCN